jgi:hypothetical protein
VRLLGRQPGRDYEAVKEEISRAAARDRYMVWAAERTRAARVNDAVLGKK